MKTRIQFLATLIFFLCAGAVTSLSQIISNGTGGGLWTSASTWSGGVIPGSSDDVIIASSDSVLVNATGVCRNLTIDGKLGDTTGVSGVQTFTVSGSLTMGSGSFLYLSGPHLLPGASFSLSSTSTVIYSGGQTALVYPTSGYGNLVFSGGALTLSTNLLVNGNLTIAGAAKMKGTGTNGTFVHTINGNVTITSTGSPALDCVDNAAATVASCTWNIGGNFNFLSSGRVSGFASGGAGAGCSGYINIGGNLTITNGQFQFGSSSANVGLYVVTVKGNLTCVSPGIITKQGGGAGGTWTISMEGTSGPQQISIGPAVGASSSVPVDLKINNPYGVALTAPLTLQGNWRLNLTNGNLNTTATNILILGTSASSAGVDIIGGSASSFINGPVQRFYSATGPSSKPFPVGNGSAYRPLSLTLTQDTALFTYYTAEIVAGAPSTRTLPGTLNRISNVRYLRITKGIGAKVTAASVQMDYSNDDRVSDYANLRLAKDDGAGAWIDLGGVGTANTAGNITSTNNFTTLGDFVLANAAGGGNFPLPPSITVTASMVPFSSMAGTPSTEQSYFVSGNYLTSNLIVTPPIGFEISLTSGSGFTSSSISLTPVSGSIGATALYVRMNSSIPGAFSGTITHASTDAPTQNVSLSGTVRAPIHNVTQNVYYVSIKAAVDAAVSGDEITIAAGTYIEGPQIVVHKNLTLTGADKLTTIIQPSASTGNALDARGWFLVDSTVTFNLSNVTLDGAGKNINIGILSHGPGIITNNIFKNIGYFPSGPDYAGRGIAFFDVNMTISNNTLSNIGRIGIYMNGPSVTNAIITGNTYTGKGLGNWLDYGIEVERGAHATISNNTISENLGIASVDGSTSAGIMATTYFAPGTQATITNNTLLNNSAGIAVGYDSTDGTSVTAHQNTFAGNAYGITSSHPIVNAIQNWWGNAAGPASTGNPIGLGDSVSANVVYSPFYLDAAKSTLSIYTLTVHADHGAVTKLPDQSTYDFGMSVTLTATPATGYHFTGWSGALTGSTNPSTVVVYSNHVVTANFAIDTLSIAATAGANGVITPSGATTVTYGSNQTYSITPSIGYVVAEVLVDGISAGAVSSYTFTNITASHTISASFVISSVTVTSNGTGGGDWNNGTTWVGGIKPRSIDAAVIAGSDIVALTSNDSCASVTIQAGGKLVLGASLGVVNATVNGTVLANASGTFNGMILFTGGSTYEHARNAGSIPMATWGTGSTCLISGVTNIAPANTNQNFYNLTWNCTGYSSAVNLAMGGNTLGGTLTVANTNSIALRLTNNTVNGGRKIITINGDVVIGGTTSSLTSTGSSGADTITIMINGNIISNGTWNLANGTGAACNWIVKGNLTLNSGTCSTNSNSAAPDSIIFTGTSTQTFTNAAGIASFSFVHFAVRSGSILNMGSTNLGTGSSTFFDLADGATLMTTHNNGINGNLTASGAKNLSSNANYIFNGTSAQVTGALLPAVIKNLTIANSKDVTLSSPTTINGVLTLSSGNMRTGGNTLTIGTAGSVARTSGAIVGNLRKSFALGATAQVFEIGDTSNYTPISIQFDNVLTSGSLIASTISGMHPQILSSGLDTVKTLNRYYTVTNEGVTFGNYTATLNFSSSDVVGGANPAKYVVKKYNAGIWTSTTRANPLATSIQSTGNTSFSDFAVGQEKSFAPKYTLSINALHGAVEKNPDEMSYDSASVVQLTAIPDVGYHFTGWSGDLSGTTNPINVTMNVNKNITANFAINVYRIFSSADATGAIYPHGDMYVNYGDSITFRMEPGAYCHITGVYVDGNPVGAVETYTLRNITADHEVWAGFQFDMYTITATADAHGSISPSGSVVAMGGFGSSFSIRPNPSYHIADVLVDGASVGPVSSYDFPLVDSDHSIHASFAINTFTLSVNTTNGTVTKNPNQPAYDSASTVQLTAVPAAGYTFTSWSGDLTGTINPVNITMSANKTITANFTLNAVTTFTLTVNANPTDGGAITKSPDAASYDSAAVVTVTAIANTGYHFVNWSGAVTGTTNPATITMTSSKIVTANFVSDTISMSISVSAGWNLLSVPLLMKNPFPPIVFPGSFGDAFQPTESGYKTVDTIKVGRGYFVYFTTPRFIIFRGVPVKGSLQVPLGIGWNLVGSREVTVDASSLVTVPSGRIYGDLFFYNASASTYYTKTQIFPGDGEWLYVIGSCTLTLP
jgi:uncharacterized repeat protein (TIGR02543 family)